MQERRRMDEFNEAANDQVIFGNIARESGADIS